MQQCKMELKIRFNRAIDKEKDYISPGGFEMIMNDKIVDFDFVTHYGYIDKTEKNICLFELVEPDTDCFLMIEDITQTDMEHISEIVACFVYTGEEGESDLEETEIMDISFVWPDGKTIKVAQNVLAAFNAKLINETKGAKCNE